MGLNDTPSPRSKAMPDANVLSILRAAYPIDSYLAPEQQKVSLFLPSLFVLVESALSGCAHSYHVCFCSSQVVRELLARFELGGGRSHQMRPLATLQLTPGAHPHEVRARRRRER